MNEINWDANQWAIIEAEIRDETEKSRLAHKVITREDRVGSEARSVSRDRYTYASGLIDETFDPILTTDHEVVLTKEQADDKNLSRAKVSVRRAAQELAVVHDTAVFRTAIRNEIVNGQAAGQEFHPVVVVNPPNGDGLEEAVAEALHLLEGDGYRTGFVMIAGLRVYTVLNRRVQGAADSPAERIEKLLENGQIHRSNVLPPDEALIISISGEEIDRAIAMDPKLDFRRVENRGNMQDVRVLRLYERFLPRFKQTRSAVLLRLAAAQQQPVLQQPAPQQPAPQQPAPQQPAPQQPAPQPGKKGK